MANSQVDELIRNMQPPKKFCTDCKWVDKSVGEDRSSSWKCKAPGLKVQFDLVSGNALSQYCSHARLGDECGPAGNLWEPQT